MLREIGRTSNEYGWSVFVFFYITHIDISTTALFLLKSFDLNIIKEKDRAEVFQDKSMVASSVQFLVGLKLFIATLSLYIYSILFS